MELNEKNLSNGPKKSTGSVLLYVASAVVAIIAVALLATNIIVFKDNVTQYTSQGYTTAEVLKSLIPMQLLPGVFEPIGMYGGIAVLLLGAARINNKVSKCMMMSEQCCQDKVENEPADPASTETEA